MALPRPRLGALKPAATAALILLVGSVAVLAVRRLASEIDPPEVMAALAALPAWRIAAAVALTAASHLLLTFYDALALRSLGEKLPWPTVARAAFTSYTLSHNLGFAPLTGGSARLRIYGAAGLEPLTVGRIVVIAGCAFWGGVMAVGAISLLLAKTPLAVAGWQLAPWGAHLAGAACLALIAALLSLRQWQPRLAQAIARVVPLPGEGAALLLLGVAALDLLFASLALMVLIPGLYVGDFPHLYLVYALAIVAGLVTHVPGGIGVFEAIFLAALTVRGPGEVAALVAYRAIYYLGPLALAVLLNLGLEARGLRRLALPARRIAGFAAREISPAMFGAMSFGGGLVLLLSGALPGVHGRMRVLVELLPLPFIEASHLAASLVGTALLLVAPALAARLESGARLARLLFMLGAAFSLAKGLDFEEASVMLVLAGLLQFAQAVFYRKTEGAFSLHNRGWLLAAAGGVALSVLSGFIAFRHVPYDGQLWWDFALRGDAPRFLRASFAAGVMVCAFALRELMYRAGEPGGDAALPPAVFERASAGSPRTDVALAFTGDKRFLVSPEGDAFLMFRPRGRTWVVMGDPVGPRERWRALAWELRRLSDRSFARLCFYQVSEAMLPIAVELGLMAIKYGEEAQVPLGGFTLAGPQMKSLRNTHARALREGLRLEVVPAAAVPGWIERLRPISDAWLAAQGSREKSFSLGRFDPVYLARFDLAVVFAGDAPTAFANIWRSGDGGEMSVDLMRHLPDGPPGAMDFLFVELMARARARGYARFNLGLAPLSGVQGGMLAPAWARLANLTFVLGTRRYNFAGLRRYKQKFRPDWQGRFIAMPQGLAGYRALFGLAALVNARG